MKIDKTTQNKMKGLISIILNHYGVNPQAITTIGAKFNVWQRAHMNVYYPDDNKNVIFVNGERLIKQDKSVLFYPCDSNDNTLSTCLNSIFAELSK